MLLRLTCLATATMTLACAGEPPVLESQDRLPLGDVVGDGRALMGVSRDPITNHLHTLVEGTGVLEFDLDGALVNTLAVDERGLRDLPYRDLASLGDGRFLLIADNEGYLWDSLTNQHRVHFCVEPGFVECFDENGDLIDGNNNGICDWQEEQPIQQPTIQRNDALSLVGAEVVAAPRFYEGEVRIEASLRSYNIADGTPTGAVDLSAIEADLRGIAPLNNDLFGVGGDRLVRFDLAGQPIEERRLETVEDAVGITVVGDDLWVLDGASRSLVRFTP